MTTNELNRIESNRKVNQIMYTWPNKEVILGVIISRYLVQNHFYSKKTHLLSFQTITRVESVCFPQVSSFSPKAHAIG